MRRLPLLLVTAAMLAPALAFPPLPVIAQSAATADQRMETARKALEAAEKSLKEAEETGGDIRAARKSVANAMKSLRAAESAAGIVPEGPPAAVQPPAAAPVQSPPATGTPAAATPAAPAPATPPTPGDGPKPYTPPATPEAPAEAGPAKPAKPAASAPSAAPKPAPPAAAKPQKAPKPAQPVVTRRNGITETRTPRADGGTIIEQRDATGRIIRRVEIAPNGTEAVIIDRTRMRNPATMEAPPRIYDPREVPPPPGADLDGGRASEAEIERALRAAPRGGPGGYSLNEIRRSDRLRQRVAAVDLDTITFPSGSARVPEDQVWKLERIGRAVRRIVERWPDQVFLIEGHTDAVGTRLANQELSARRAASVASILVRYFGVPPRNLVTEGYGEDYLKIPTDGPSRENRRVTIRNITPLLGR